MAEKPLGTTRDEEKLDSLGTPKNNVVPVGPRGANLPPDVLSADEKQAVADKQDARMAQGMSSTAAVDSVGRKKGSFKTAVQGVDKHGMRIPDKVDYNQPTETHAPMVGPRGANAPQDTFHGPRPVKKA